MAEIVALKRESQSEPVAAVLTRGTLRIVLNAPPANALSLAMMDALLNEIDRATRDPAIRTVVIAATGAIFCAGHDLKELTARRTDADGGEAFFASTFTACANLMQAILACPKPVIAEIDGLATAAGAQLVATCDLAIASDKATFCTPGVNIGLFCATPSVALSRTIARKHALEMLFTGETIDAASAREFGLVNRVTPREYLTQVVMKYAQAIGAKPAATLADGKAAFYAQSEMPTAEAYGRMSRVMVEAMLGAEAQEGIGAFLDKREPKWPDA